MPVQLASAARESAAASSKQLKFFFMTAVPFDRARILQ
jgi:hypothetical protein